jgi:hypothetical protein
MTQSLEFTQKECLEAFELALYYSQSLEFTQKECLEAFKHALYHNQLFDIDNSTELSFEEVVEKKYCLLKSFGSGYLCRESFMNSYFSSFFTEVAKLKDLKWNDEVYLVLNYKHAHRKVIVNICKLFPTYVLVKNKYAERFNLDDPRENMSCFSYSDICLIKKKPKQMIKKINNVIEYSFASDED